MLGAIRYALGNLTRFEGRDARQTFWFYVLFLVIVEYAVGMVVSLPMMGAAAGGAVQGVQAGLTQAQVQARVMADMSGYLRTSMTISAGISAITALLMLASFARRLHDSGRPAWIAVLALMLSLGAKAFVLAKLDDVVASAGTGGMQAAMTVQSKLLAGSLMGWAAMLIVVVFGAWPSNQGPNRYGDAPVRF